jgi:tRNA (adenine22-N1)-methyltransferase
MPENPWRKRLDTIADLVPLDTRGVADIGYDHGYLLAKLARSHATGPFIGVEIQPDAHTRAATTLNAKTLKRLELRHGDALTMLKPSEVDTLIIAGLGELKILDMLDERRDVAESLKRLILCPANFKGALRIGMAKRGWRCIDEDIAFDRERFYPVTVFARGPGHLDSPFDYVGPIIAQREPRKLLAYLEDLFGRTQGALNATQRPVPGETKRDQRRRDYLETIAQLPLALKLLKKTLPAIP